MKFWMMIKRTVPFSKHLVKLIPIQIQNPNLRPKHRQLHRHNSIHMQNLKQNQKVKLVFIQKARLISNTRLNLCSIQNFQLNQMLEL